jgi:hypothetical protein
MSELLARMKRDEPSGTNNVRAPVSQVGMRIDTHVKDLSRIIETTWLPLGMRFNLKRIREQLESKYAKELKEYREWAASQPAQDRT